MKENEFDIFVRNLMHGAEESVSPDIWTRVEAGLDAQARPKRVVPAWVWLGLSGVAVAAAAVAALVAAGCNRIPGTANHAAELSYPIDDEFDKPNLSIDISIDYPVKGLPDSVMAKMTENILVFAFDLEDEPLSVPETVDAEVSRLEDEYRGDNLEFWKAEKEELSKEETDEFYCWEYRVYGYFGERWRNWISYYNESYTYSGGVHGMHGLCPIVFDARTGEPVTEREIFDEGYETVLTEALRKHLLDIFPEESDEYESLFVKDITPNGCFDLSRKGITYYYQPYEIGAYYLGVIQVTVPWKELKGFI